jgi:hypothetical protein
MQASCRLDARALTAYAELMQGLLVQGTLGPEIDGGSHDMRETWMLLEYADRGNLDRALVQQKMMTAQNCLDVVSYCSASGYSPCAISMRLCAGHVLRVA